MEIWQRIPCVLWAAAFLYPAQTGAGFVSDVTERIKSVLFQGFTIHGFLTDLMPLYAAFFGGTLSIDYFLFTPNNTKEACYLVRTTESLRNCSFDPHLETKIFLHGYDVELTPEAIFFEMKDRLLERGEYNVMVLNYTKYCVAPFLLGGFVNAYWVGIDVALQIKFLQDETNATAESFHLIGHSLGAHVAGYAGKSLPNLGRITGLDPASEFYEFLSSSFRLCYSDANFVDVIHVSNIMTGFGVYRPIGDLDYYVNGGMHQPNCDENDYFQYTGGEYVKIGDNKQRKMSCTHDKVLTYFLESIYCRFVSVLCPDDTKFQKGLCTPENAVISHMGLDARKIPGLPPMTSFYLNTNPDPPYCNTAK